MLGGQQSCEDENVDGYTADFIKSAQGKTASNMCYLLSTISFRAIDILQKKNNGEVSSGY
jgi:hypothetical protein